MRMLLMIKLFGNLLSPSFLKKARLIIKLLVEQDLILDKNDNNAEVLHNYFHQYSFKSTYSKILRQVSKYQSY